MMPKSLVADGNAASNATNFFQVPEGLQYLQNEWRVIQAEFWNDRDGSKRKIMAETLVPDRISPDCIHTIFVADLNSTAQDHGHLQRIRSFR